METLVLNDTDSVHVLLTNIQSLKKLRHLEDCFTDMEELPDSVTSLSNLQTLDLNHCELKVIPESISGLKSLRFLNISFNPIEELPVSVTTLSNLETLDVNTCKNLKALPEYVADLANLKIFNFENCPLLKALPEDFGALTQLRSLNLDGTDIKVLPESCSNLNNLELVYLHLCVLPKDVKNWTKLRRFYYKQRKAIISGIGKLECLQELIYLVPENEPEHSDGIEELGNLSSLVGVRDLQNVKHPIDAARANLKGKRNLIELGLHWGKKEEERVGMRSDQIFQVFEALQPPPCLRRLHVRNFMGLNRPSWICLPSLVELTLMNCKGMKQLPAGIGKLPHLRRAAPFISPSSKSGYPRLQQVVQNPLVSLFENVALGEDESQLNTSGLSCVITKGPSELSVPVKWSISAPED
ncbi:leucine-rich repeat-containing protein 1-like [Papaver somniferum]|uniref:leucine-rich repeat-containing protein 1-like n=1 Tax=Papaver somniferum TaxID=3469 RepID=UPI000E6FFD3B|nr:leucine-rich repeat-containing protein 1-like [Papaver somniferum]